MIATYSVKMPVGSTDFRGPCGLFALITAHGRKNVGQNMFVNIRLVPQHMGTRRSASNLDFALFDSTPYGLITSVYYKRSDVSTCRRRECGVLTAGLLLSLAILLLRSGDVESNPGPLYGSISADEKLERILGQMSHIFKEIHGMGTAIQHVAGRQDHMQARINRLEDIVERQEQQARRANLIFYGLKETTGETIAALRAVVVQLLMHYFPFKQWCDKDVDDVHRIGGRVHDSTRTRPLFVKFARQSDALDVLRYQQGRSAFRDKEDVRVAADLTQFQRDTIHDYRQQGKRAFYVGGRLRVQDANTYTRRPHQQSQQFGERGGRGMRDAGPGPRHSSHRSPSRSNSGLMNVQSSETDRMVVRNQSPPNHSPAFVPPVTLSSPTLVHQHPPPHPDQSQAEAAASSQGRVSVFFGENDWDKDSVSQSLQDGDFDAASNDGEANFSPIHEPPGGGASSQRYPPPDVFNANASGEQHDSFTQSEPLRGFGRGSPLTPDGGAVRGRGSGCRGRQPSARGKQLERGPQRMTRSMVGGKQSKLPDSWATPSGLTGRSRDRGPDTASGVGSSQASGEMD